MIRRRHRALLVAIGLLAALPAAAAVYRWVDKDGNVHYSDKPVTPQAQRTHIKSRPTDPKQASQSLEDLRNQASDYRQQVQAQQQSTEDAEKARKEREARCKKAREDLAKILPARKMYKLNDKGERVYQTDDERVKAVEKARERVNELCGDD
ncbi:MAG: DUF4124 domain-containing protein [Gammaproteobacteria bacterium]